MSDFDLKKAIDETCEIAKIGAIITLQGMIADQGLTTISQVNGLLHNIIMGDESLDNKARQYEVDARADHNSGEQFNNV